MAVNPVIPSFTDWVLPTNDPNSTTAALMDCVMNYWNWTFSRTSNTHVEFDWYKIVWLETLNFYSLLFVVYLSLNVEFKMMACTTVITSMMSPNANRFFHSRKKRFFSKLYQNVYYTTTYETIFFSPTWRSRKPYLFPVKYRLYIIPQVSDRARSL